MPDPPHPQMFDGDAIPVVTGDEDWLCIGPEDAAVMKGELPAPRSRYEGEEPGVLSERGKGGE